jgi:hypothetical protein
MSSDMTPMKQNCQLRIYNYFMKGFHPFDWLGMAEWLVRRPAQHSQG